MESSSPSSASFDPDKSSAEITSAEDVAARGELSDAVAKHEHLVDLARARVVFALALPVVVVFAAADFAYAHVVGADVRALLGLRVALAAWFALCLFRVTRKADPIGVTELDTLLFGTLLSVIGVASWMCVVTGGFTSYYATANLLVMTGTSYVPRPWQRTWKPLLGCVLLYPGTLLASTLVSDLTRAQLDQPLALMHLAVHTSMLTASAMFVAGGGHLVWSMRRQLSESRSIGRYQLRRRLGKGGMGEVWAAYHRGLGREVALKILRLGEESEPLAAARFIREIRATAELVHPNTVRVFDHGSTEDGLLFYAMEILSGESLRALVRREGALPPGRAVHLVGQAARALAEAHKRGIVHRDVKPENLFVTDAGGERDFVKVLDFGVAKLIQRKDADLTREGALAGTPSTMSPEAILRGEVGPPADVYALGVVLYFTLTGRLPFEGDSATRLVAHLSEPVVPPSLRSRYFVPLDLEAVVMRALAKDPRDRYADAGELAAALAATSVGSHAPGAAGEPPRMRSIPPPAGADDETRG